ncbi:MAG TPA: hypothetical protein VJX94_27145 [Stellaceae bacterium]|nr:hypothetical protein [Stellaceae bacterium]
MAVEREVTPRFPALERRHDVGHDLAGRNHAEIRAVLRQELTDVTGRLTCVAGRVWAPATDEAAEETEQDLAIALDPLQQFRFAVFHSGSPDAFACQAVGQFMGQL